MTSGKNKEEQREKDEHNFNSGRISADDKWKTAIDRRIEELEKQVGIPELRKLKKDTQYRWGLYDEDNNAEENIRPKKRTRNRTTKVNVRKRKS